MSAPFVAKYRSKCWECEDFINEGDRARFDDLSHICHETCPGQIPNETCPKCFMEKANNGTCGCDA